MVSEPLPSCDIFVIGTASFDVLRLAGRVAHAPGGAGLYTALAAHRAGAIAGLFAPRPDLLPKPFHPIIERLHWLGPVISPETLPRLEIEHHGGGRATLLDASWGAEPQLTPAIMPAEVSQAAYVHIAALSSVERQLDFLQAVTKSRGAGEQEGRGEKSRPRISVGTYARLVYGDAKKVRHLFEQADLFFMNENEAKGVFGSVEQAQTRSDRLLFVTLGEDGALVIEGKKMTHIPGRPTRELDPTGAGDTFCGATLAGLAHGQSPVAAAKRAVALAARTVSAVGLAALLDE